MENDLCDDIDIESLELKRTSRSLPDVKNQKTNPIDELLGFASQGGRKKLKKSNQSLPDIDATLSDFSQEDSIADSLNSSESGSANTTVIQDLPSTSPEKPNTDITNLPPSEPKKIKTSMSGSMKSFKNAKVFKPKLSIPPLNMKLRPRKKR